MQLEGMKQLRLGLEMSSPAQDAKVSSEACM